MISFNAAMYIFFFLTAIYLWKDCSSGVKVVHMEVI